MWPTAEKWLTRSLLVVLLVVLAIVYFRYVRSTPGTQPVGEVSTAKVPKAVERIIERITRVQEPGPPRIVYLNKPELAAALKMPELTKEPGMPVAVAEVKPHTGTTTAVALLDNNTGMAHIVVQPQAPPFFQLKKELGIRGGVGTGGLVVGELYLRPLQINARDRGTLNVELRGFVRRTDADGADFGGAALLDYRF